MDRVNENKDEPKLNYEDFYKLTGCKLTGKISHSSSYEIDAKLNEIMDELEEELSE